MSGSKQHYIPRLLLRSFRNTPKGKVCRVHVYRSDRDYVSPVEDVAAQRFFYSESRADDEDVLDDVITRYENGLASDLRQIVETNLGNIDPNIAARTVAHLFFRTDHVRGFLRTGAVQFGDIIRDLFGSDEKIAAAMGIDTASPGPRFDELFDKHLAEHPTLAKLELPQPAIRSLIFAMLREAVQAGFGELSDTISNVANQFRDEGPALAREAHNDILITSLTPKARCDELAALSWSVEGVDSPLFILPDFVALAISTEGQAKPLLGVKNSEVAAVMMPLSPCRMLIGTRNASAIDILRFNELAAPNCFDFFVSAVTSTELMTLAKTIGSSVAAELDFVFRDVVTQFRARLNKVDYSTDKDKAATSVRLNGKMTIVTDCLSTEDTQRLSVILDRLLSIAYRFDISALLHVEVMTDYDQALATLDRGALSGSQPAPKASEEGYSAAYNVPVERDGKFAVVMVLREAIARGMLSEDDHLFASAASIFMKQTARIGSDTLLTKIFAGGLRTGTACDSLLISYALPAWKEWSIAQYGCLFQSEDKLHHFEVLIEQLKTLRDRLEAIRRAYRLHGDVDTLLNEALNEAAQVLTTAAVAAASPAFDETDDAQMNETFSKTLDTLGYLYWFKLFKTDVAAIWRDGAVYPHQDAFLALNRHLERLLMEGTIFLWEDDGRIRVEVPYWLDWEWMAANSSENTSA